MPLTPRDIVEMLNTWYGKENKAVVEEQTFYSVAKEILDGRLQCGTTKLNQGLFCEYLKSSE
jgi:hypothetical protein